MNSTQKLGIKVFYYYLFKKIAIGIVLLVVSVIVASSKATLISKIVSLFPKNPPVMIVDYLINGLFIVSILLIICAIFISWLNYINCDFSLGENAFSIRRGILSKKEISIPYRQIQNVDIEQTFNHKMMGVSKLVILTAGNDDNDKEGEAEGVFDVIDSNVAIKIREFVLQKANVQMTNEVKG